MGISCVCATRTSLDYDLIVDRNLSWKILKMMWLLFIKGFRGVEGIEEEAVPER
jgi:hypothetical protein